MSISRLHEARGAGVGLSRSGVLLLDKPAGISSQTAVSRVKRLIGCNKAGHTGTLDPLATGLLPICVGEATKFAQILLDAEKAYEASIRLGITTTTGDREGDTVSTSPVAAGREAIGAVLAQFVGVIDQVPPMFSAIKYRGRPLYRMAREGITVARRVRQIRIRSLDLIEFEADLLRVRIVCGKGTYVRVLAEDIGRALGCGAFLDALRRTGVGELTIRQSIPLDTLAAQPPAERLQNLLDADTTVRALPRLDIDPPLVHRLMHGQAVPCDSGCSAGLVRLYDALTGNFLGVGTCAADGVVTARRLVAQAPNIS